MKTIEIAKGKINDTRTDYYLAMRPGCSYCASEVLSDIYIPGCDYNIVLRDDEGWRAGTLSDLRASDIHYVFDYLLDRGIIAEVDGEYVAGANYYKGASSLISLVEYAAKHGKSRITVSQMAARGSFKTAQKIGRNWVIDSEEPYPDNRIKSGKYVGQRQKNIDKP